tara:strand:+ start:17274 stop:18197 length:924 start_codon:yes stop_codon:yes gene_type:complete
LNTPLPSAAAAAPADQENARPENQTLGVALVVAATCLFASNDVINKFLVGEFEVPAVAAVRYMIHGLVLAAVLAPSQGRRLIETRRTGAVIARALCLVGSTLFLGLALQHMPVAETTAIIYLSPLLVMLLAPLILGERIGPLGWISAILGFTGVLLIVRPGGGLDPAGIALALANVGFTTAYYLLSRVLSATETTQSMLFYTAVVGTICFGLALPWFWLDRMPNPLVMVMFAGLGGTAALGHFMFTAAYRYAEASLLAPATYTHLLWAGLLGWLVFGHIPALLSITGMAIILLAGVLSAMRTRLRRV